MTDVEAEQELKAGGAARAVKRARGASFPTIPLGEAVALSKKIASYGSTHTQRAVAAFLGHTTSNSGPFRTKVAALKDYGLLTGRADELTVTSLALQLTHPGIDANPQDALAQAFRSCKLFSTVYDTLPKGPELDVESLSGSAIHNHGVATQAKDAFATSFVKSAETAGLLETLEGGKFRIPEVGVVDAPEEVADAGDVEDAPARVRNPVGRGALPATLAPSNAVVKHVWPIEGGVVHFIVERDRPLPATAYGVIGSVIEAGDKLATMLGQWEVLADDGGDPA